MSKVKIETDPSTPPIPPMPGAEASGTVSGSLSIGEPKTVNDEVGEELAGELIGMPYEFWAQLEPEDCKEAILLSEKTKAFLAGPAARVMEKYGVGRFAKDEIVLITGLGLHTFMAIRATRRIKAARIQAPDVKHPES